MQETDHSEQTNKKVDLKLIERLYKSITNHEKINIKILGEVIDYKNDFQQIILEIIKIEKDFKKKIKLTEIYNKKHFREDPRLIMAALISILKPCDPNKPLFKRYH